MMTGHDVELLLTAAMYLQGGHPDEARALVELSERISDDLRAPVELSSGPPEGAPSYTCPLCQMTSQGSLHWHRTVQMTRADGNEVTVRCPVAELANMGS
jgi:hypothetical protein